MPHPCLELAACHLTSEVCSQFVKTAKFKLIVLLDHRFIYDSLPYIVSLKLLCDLTPQLK